jgi:hypothetical protein
LKSVDMSKPAQIWKFSNVKLLKNKVAVVPSLSPRAPFVFVNASKGRVLDAETLGFALNHNLVNGSFALGPRWCRPDVLTMFIKRVATRRRFAACQRLRTHGQVSGGPRRPQPARTKPSLTKS